MSAYVDAAIITVLALVFVGLGYLWGQVRLTDFWIRRFHPQLAGQIEALDARTREIERKERDLEGRSLALSVVEMRADRAERRQTELERELDSIASEPNRQRLLWLLRQTAAFLNAESSVMSFSRGREVKRVDSERAKDAP